jgi:hypothetical protein
MPLIAKGVLSSRIANVKKSKEAFRTDVQEVLISCAFQAAMGNPNYANELLEAVRDTVHIKGLTLWLETYAPLVVRQDKFVINKGMAKTMHVTCEADFSEYEKEMSKVNWWEMAAPQKATSVFDAVDYTTEGLQRMADKLHKNGAPDLANEVKALLTILATKEAYKAAVAAKA